MQRTQSNLSNLSNPQDSKTDGAATGEIQMQNFSEGLPPPPPVGHSWKRVDGWMEHNYEELFENLCEGCTQNDINELEHELDCTLPMEVRESLQIHDGQERGGRPTGVIFGCMLLDCEEIVQEWNNWRKVNEEYLREQNNYPTPQYPSKAFAGSSSSAAPPAPAANGNWRQDLLSRQDSQPPNAVQKAYVHPAWIPLARDWGGNNICVDLAPGPTGKWGQIIIMGRDYDCKYVISRSWAAFLATVADDLSTDKWFIDEDTAELKLGEFRHQNVEPAYLDILRWRADQKFGRRQPKKRPGQPLRINSNVASQMNGFSPYASPATGNDERGRSPQRMNGKQPATSSPRAHVSSPLARVAEELPSAVKVRDFETANKPGQASKLDNLVSLDTPVVTDNLDAVLESSKGSLDSGSEQSSAKDSKMNDLKENTPVEKEKKEEEASTEAGAEDLKTVEI